MFFELLEIVLGMLCYSVKFTFVPQLMLNKCVYFWPLCDKTNGVLVRVKCTFVHCVWFIYLSVSLFIVYFTMMSAVFYSATIGLY